MAEETRQLKKYNSDCGANGPGGKGFQPGNTCAKGDGAGASAGTSEDAGDGDSTEKEFTPEGLASAIDKWVEDAGIDAADKWTRKQGYHELPSKEVIQAVADEQQQSTGDPDEETLKAYESFKKSLVSQYEAITKAGLKVRAWKGEGEPYKVSEEKPWSPSSSVMRSKVAETGEFLFFMTEKGFGSDGATESSKHPLLQMSDLKTSDGEPMLYNDVFRVVHDAVAHLYGGFSFSTQGEMNGMVSHASTLPRDSWPALWAETFAQNAVYDTTGKFAEQNVFTSKHLGVLEKLVQGGNQEKSMAGFEEFDDDDEPLGFQHLKRQPGNAPAPVSEESDEDDEDGEK